MTAIIAPSLLSANFATLHSEITMLNQSDASWLHFDVMDGVFVPNISFGFEIIKTVRALSEKTLDVHLMIVQPERYITRFKQAGADVLTVHYEACDHLHRVVEEIKEANMKVGVAINPHTPVHLLEDILPELDMVLIMSVNPGFGGQKFIENTYNKILKLQEMILECGSNTLIEVDGGVNLSNAGELISLGVDVLVAGNTVFSAPNPKEVIHQLASLK